MRIISLIAIARNYCVFFSLYLTSLFILFLAIARNPNQQGSSFSCLLTLFSFQDAGAVPAFSALRLAAYLLTGQLIYYTTFPCACQEVFKYFLKYFFLKHSSAVPVLRGFPRLTTLLF